MSRDHNYYVEACQDAQVMFDNFVDTMAEMAADGEVSDDLYNDYPDGDSYHHETHTDRPYDLTAAAQVLDELRRWEEDNRGLWDGLPPRDAIAVQAAYTYAACVYDLWRDKIKELNAHLAGFEFDNDDERADFCDRFVHAYVFLTGRPEDEFDGLTRGAMHALERGEFTGLLVLADRFDEDGEGLRADDLRKWATPKYTPEPVKETDEPGEPKEHPGHPDPDREDHRPEAPAG